MENLISKELLSEVLKEDVLSIKPYIKDEEFYKNIIIYECRKNTYDTINIYELAHKCKEWAFSQGYLYWYENNELYIKRLYSCKVDFVVDIGNYNKHFEIDIDFKSCQWILSNKDNL